MSPPSEKDPGAQAAIPCPVVVITLGLLSIIHFAIFLGNGALWSWKDGALDHAFTMPGSRLVRAPVQQLRAAMDLSANDVVTREGELYYRPDIKHVQGHSFLKPPGTGSHVVVTRESFPERQWNPIPAIMTFDRQLKKKGIRLVLLPVPSKAAFANDSQPPILNEGYPEFLRILRSDLGVEVLDLVPLLHELQAQGRPLFLEGDSHWTPETVHEVARLVAEHASVQSPATPFPTVERTLSSTGDLAHLLGQRARKETITSSMVLGHNEGVWKPAREAPFLLLGDSFANIYSLEEMGWGKGAGLAEMLSLEMSAPVDRIARNADGAFASREELLRDPGRLLNKSVVVWQFAMRELSFGNWKVLPLPREERPGRPGAGPVPQQLEATIARVAKVPPLTRTPYRQAVREVLLENVRSESGLLPGRVVLLGYAVQDHLPTGMARWEEGDQVSVQVIPWEDVEGVNGRLHRFALRDPGLELLEIPWVWIK